MSGFENSAIVSTPVVHEKKEIHFIISIK